MEDSSRFSNCSSQHIDTIIAMEWIWLSNHGLDSGEGNSQHVDAIIVKEWLSQQDRSILRMQQMYWRLSDAAKSVFVIQTTATAVRPKNGTPL